MNEKPNNLTPPLQAISEELRSLVDGYVADAITPAEMDRLEALLRDDVIARRYFARYAMLDRDIHLEVHARKQGEAALARIGIGGEIETSTFAKPAAQRSVAPGSLAIGATRYRPFKPVRWFAAAASIAAAVGVGWMVARSQIKPPLAINPPSTVPATAPANSSDVAWLVNAQNCQWTDSMSPADMRAGKQLSLDRGLAELKFRSGAVLLVEGPAKLELISGNSARLHRGRLTGKVEGPIKGFELLSPRGKVIDLGTEFGVAVSESGQTDVHVFNGKVQAIADAATGTVVDLKNDQTARIDRGGVTIRPISTEAADFTRQIVPPPVIEPRTLRVNFGKGYDGTIADAQGLGTGLTQRLPGTGTDLPAMDPNLVVNSAEGQLELTTTKSDINGQASIATGEYLGVRLADLGFTGSEDFEVQMFVPNIPALQNVGQFGLYAGAKSDKVIRGGLISRASKGIYTLFMTNNDGGRDRDSHELGLVSIGDDARFRLKRTNGKYALTVENVTTGGSSTIAIRHPSYLDPENDLYVGLFGANTQSDVRKTLLIKEFSVTVWTNRTNSGAVAKGIDNDRLSLVHP